MPKRNIKSKIFLAAEIILLLASITAFVKISVKKRNVENEIIYLKSTLSTKKEERRSIKNILNNLSSNSYVELDAKRKLNLKMPGETVFVFYEDNDYNLKKEIDCLDEKCVFLKSNNNQANVSNPVLWWRYFFKK